jgi:hypothetical protein
MKEYYMLSCLCKKLISYSLWSRVKKDQNQNNFQLNLSEEEIRILINLIDKRLEELTNDKEK